MSFLRTSTSFTRFKLTEPAPSTLWNEVTDRLRKYSITDIDELPEERAYGWTAFEDFLDTTFVTHPVEKGVYLTFSLRLDTRRVPPAVIKKYLAISLKKEEAINQEQGKKSISRDRKKELREQVMLKLRMRFLPIPAEFQVIWNTATGIVFFSSTQGKMIDLFQEQFSKTFELDLEPITPYELAASMMSDTAALDTLDTLEPTTFA